MWKELKDIALLGTERRELSLDALPEEIKLLVATSKAPDSETQFLETLAFYNLYLEGGRKPGLYQGEFPSEPIEETDEQAPGELEQLFAVIQELDAPLKTTLLEYWLDTLVKKNLIVGANNAIELIKLSEKLSDPIKHKVEKVIGNKGKSILPYLPGFSVMKTTQNNKVWDEGTTKERKAQLECWAKENPQEAVRQIEATWQQEPITVKSTFLKVIRDNPHEAFLPFIENCYNGEFSHKAKEKKNETQNRQLTAEILLSFPQTALFKETFEALCNYILVENKKAFFGIAGTKQQITIALPTEDQDTFWNAENIHKKYGFETKNYDFGLFKSDVLHWLNCFISAIPLDILAQGLGIGIAQLSNAFLNNKQLMINQKGVEQPIYLNALIQNANNCKNPELCLSLINRLPLQQSIQLLKYISKEEYEKYARNIDLLKAASVLEWGPFIPGGENWSLDFSKHVLTRLSEWFMSGKSFYQYSIGNVIGQFLHPGVYPVLAKLQNTLSGTNYLGAWNKHIHAPVENALHIKQILNKYQ